MYGLDLRDHDVFWPTGDPGWGYGFVCYLGALALGATIVSVQGNPSPELCLSVLERYGITNLATTPTLLRGLMSLDETVVRTSPIRLRAISSCGEPLNAKVVEFFQTAWKLTPMDHFGATEFALPVGNYNALDMAVKPGSMGLPSPGYRMAVIDETGHELPNGQVGLLGRASTAYNCYWLRYWEDPQASCDVVRNGWIVTGDLARRDEDGYFWFEGRAGDMIKSAGYRIGPFEVESALLRHPAVAEAAVFGKADDPVRLLRDRFVVRHHDNSQVVLAVQGAQERHDLGARLGIEIAGGLIGQQQRRSIYQRASDGDALLLATGKLCRAMFEAVIEPHALQRFVRAPSPLSTVNFGEAQWQLDILFHAHCGDQVERLKNNAHGFSPMPRQLLRTHAGELAAKNGDSPGSRPIEARDNVQQR